MKRNITQTITKETTKLGQTQFTIRDLSNRKAPIEVGIAGQAILFHQVNPRSFDVLEVTVSQAYDILTVISKVLDIPVKGFE